jgi:uncharacterized phage protein (TIGR01671 family)
MREILFRGKRIDNGEWVFGSLLVEGDGRKIVVPKKGMVGCFVIMYPIDPKTVGQYTGLEDKNGVKIFEGDIVQDELGKVFLVEYVRFGYVLKQIGEPWCRFPYEYDEYEVIGNIYDNPDLLEVKD